METINYFVDCSNEIQVKKLYRELAFNYHPDLGGCEETMKLINNQYLDALKASDGKTYYDQRTQKDFTYRYNREEEEAILNKIDELLKEKLQGVEIYLIGKWIWVMGETKPVKESLKKLGLKFHIERACWFWHEKPWHKRNTKAPLSHLARKYGVERFEQEKNRQLEH